jgi:hypothetical protein
MRNFLLIALGAFFAFPLAAVTPDAPVTAITHVTVIPMDRERELDDQTVLVHGDRIIVVGPAARTKVPKSAHIIDGTGKFLIPGLTDAHVHLYSPIEFTLYLDNGVTTVFNLNGRPAHLRWRDRIAKGEMVGPTIFTAGPTIAHTYTPEEAVKLVDEQAAAGYDAVKIYNQVGKEEYPALIAEAKRKNMLLMGHVARKPDFELTLRSGQSIAHLEEYTYTFFNPQRDDVNKHIIYDEAKIPEAVKLTKDSGIFVVATLSTYRQIVEQATDLDHYLTKKDLTYLPSWFLASLQPSTNRYKNGFDEPSYPRIRQSLAFQCKLLKALSDADVPLLTGTDSTNIGPVSGFSEQEELAEFVHCGLTPYQALRAATANAAAYFRQSDQFGVIKPGAHADLLLLDADPLADIANTKKISGVMARGHWRGRDLVVSDRENILRRYAEAVQTLKDLLKRDVVAADDFAFESDPFGDMTGYTLSAFARESGVGSLKTVLSELKAKKPDSALAQESAINTLGYGLLNTGDRTGAITIFRLNTELYPKSGNTYDSLGETLALIGDEAGAISNYKQALAVQPDYGNAAFAKEFLAKHEKTANATAK